MLPLCSAANYYLRCVCALFNRLFGPPLRRNCCRTEIIRFNSAFRSYKTSNVFSRKE